MNTFGTNLRKAREARQLSQQQLAELAELSQAAISSYERGNRIAPRHLLRLANALQVSPEWLMHGCESVNAHRSIMAEPTAWTEVPFQFQWPFRTIHPVDYYKLNEEQRQLIEQTVHNLIQLAKLR